MTKDQLPHAASTLLQDNILHYWQTQMTDTQNGGFYGRRDGHDRLYPKADKGAILNARILWAFSAAYRVLRRPDYLETATRARDYLLTHFIDQQYGGVYWSLDYKGRPVETKKQTYAIGFAIYGLSEYARATGDQQALQAAIALFHDIEQHCFDPGAPARPCGYREALTREWQPIADMRLSDKDENGSRTMNTHLHILEPYTNLYRVWHDEHLEQQLRTLIHLFTRGPLLNPQTAHLDLFFDDDWQGRRDIESYGHDIEAAWLLTEALQVLGDEQLTRQLMPVVGRITRAAEEGLLPDGSMIHEAKGYSPHSVPTRTDSSRQWWVQCECVIGELNAWQHFSDEAALEKALRCYDYIDQHLVDHTHGEWHWDIQPDGTVNTVDDKAGFWKCPYHNSRMCLEIIERLGL